MSWEKKERKEDFSPVSILKRVQFYPSKHLLVLKTSSTRLQRKNFTSSKTSWKRVEDVLQRRFEDVLEDEKFLRWRRVEDVLKTCLKDVLKTCLEDVWNTCLEDLLRILWRQTKYLLEISVYLPRDNKSKCVFHKSISDISNANPKCIN